MRKEHERLLQDKNREVYWKRWGPYLSERAWGTVREDYSANGDAWGYLPTITRALAPIAGTRTVLPDSATAIS